MFYIRKAGLRWNFSSVPLDGSDIHRFWTVNMAVLIIFYASKYFLILEAGSFCFS